MNVEYCSNIRNNLTEAHGEWEPHTIQRLSPCAAAAYPFMLGDGGNGVGAAVVSGGLALGLLSLNAARLVLTQAAGSVSLLS
jgi:hypothetical protein